MSEDAQNGRGGAGPPSAGPSVYVGPDEGKQWGRGRVEEIRSAARRGGAALAAGPEEAEAVVWLGAPSDLSERLHEGVRWVQLPSAGVESWFESGALDAGNSAGGAAGSGAGRVFTSAVGAYAGQVAEHALALMLAGARRLPECARARSWTDLFGRPLAGSTVVILGAGGIGRALIGLLEPFGTEILAVTRSGREVPGAAESFAIADAEALWPRGDFFVVAAPATGETRHLIGAGELAAMGEGAWVVNVARGPLIDTNALVEALAEGRIGGAALDVTDPEPLPDGHPLWAEPRALITPHSANPPGAMTRSLAERVEENVARFAAGRDLLGVVDTEAGY